MPTTTHVWKFFRIGGLDQVSLETADDLLNLKHLDQKLWVALSCPVKGLELDEKTLGLIDVDKDGRIRVPELLAAIDWAAARLKDPADLLKGKEKLSLSALNDSTAEGKSLIASAKEILHNLGRTDATEISLDEAANISKVFASSTLNGDGVITAASTSSVPLKTLVADIIATQGAVPDRSGQPGVDQAKLDAFYADCAAYTHWHAAGESADIRAFGAETAAAVALIEQIRTKVEDYFARTRLAAFDERSLAVLNRAEADYAKLAASDITLSSGEIAALPLARVEPNRPLPLLESVNPAWAEVLVTFQRTVVAAVFGPQKTQLTPADWKQLQTRIAPFTTWQKAKAGASVEKLGLARIAEILRAGQRQELADLIARDAALAPNYVAITAVEQLLRYTRDFCTLLRNFVNFTAFYSPAEWATFQAGVLYLDSRSTEFCIRVEGPSPLAAMSRAYIAYCDLKRPGGQTMKIAACFTQGDSDYLFVGRNGLFYDRQGRDWDATITSIVENPISIRQAFWLPYKKFIRMIEEQVAKRAAAADAAANERLGAAATTVATADKAVAAPKPAEPKKVDVGAVAAIGVAITGAISALTLILGYIFRIQVWQYPLLVLGLIAVISGPSMLIAWLKLRQRTLAPILEANGWAINGRVKINLPFGTSLTKRAHLPPNARRSLDDPYRDKDAERRRRLFILVVVVLIAGAVWTRWDRIQQGHYFWQSAPALTAPPDAAPAPAPSPAS